MLGNLLVDYELEPQLPLDRNCGRCSICIDQCPTGAIVAPVCDQFSVMSIVSNNRTTRFNPHRTAPKLGDWVFGCDVCQDVCPYTRGAAQTVNDPDFRPANIDRAFPRLEWLLTMTEDDFRSSFRGSAVLRTKRAGLARNAAVALGNIGGEEAVRVLSRTLLQHELELVRNHAAWALGKIGDSEAKRALERAFAGSFKHIRQR